VHSGSVSASDSIISPDLLLETVAAVREFRAVTGPRSQALAPLELEPALQQFLDGALLEIAGRMSLSGCSPQITHAVHSEASFLLSVTFEVVRQAHRRLFADLLPEPDAAREVSDASPEEAEPEEPGD